MAANKLFGSRHFCLNFIYLSNIDLRQIAKSFDILLCNNFFKNVFINTCATQVAGQMALLHRGWKRNNVTHTPRLKQLIKISNLA